MERKLYCFWTGENEIPPIRQASIDSMTNSGLKVVLVTPDSLHDYISKKDLHQSYWNLSVNHRSDYLRAYFMHHFGGGYCDIKRVDASWIETFEEIEARDTLFGGGYREIHRHGVANLHQSSQLLEESRARLALNWVRWRWLQVNFWRVIGNCAFIFRPNTPFTQLWWAELNRRLDSLAPALAANPATELKERMKTEYRGKISQYPVPWAFLQADVMQPLALRYGRRILRTLPPPDFLNYQ